VDISTRFEDWIDQDLLQVDNEKTDEVILKDYSINERTLTVDQRDDLVLTLTKDGWRADRMSKGQSVDSSRMTELLATLDELSIVGVRPKPQGISGGLKSDVDGVTMSTVDQLSLQQKGFYLSRDGQLLSNEGELQVHTTDGVLYTLRFGEVLYGSGLAVTAGAGEEEAEKAGAAANRYLFVTASFDRDYFGSAPPAPSNDEFRAKADSLWTDEDRTNKKLRDELDRWTRKVEKGQSLAESLNARFADWYYVISAAGFEKLDLDRGDLLVNKE
jgi:hypothetical protein